MAYTEPPIANGIATVILLNADLLFSDLVTTFFTDAGLSQCAVHFPPVYNEVRISAQTASRSEK